MSYGSISGRHTCYSYARSKSKLRFVIVSNIVNQLHISKEQTLKHDLSPKWDQPFLEKELLTEETNDLLGPKSHHFLALSVCNALETWLMRLCLMHMRMVTQIFTASRRSYWGKLQWLLMHLKWYHIWRKKTFASCKQWPIGLFGRRCLHHILISIFILYVYSPMSL